MVATPADAPRAPGRFVALDSLRGLAALCIVYYHIGDFGWIAGLRTRPALQGVILGGITVAGLAVVDVVDLAERVGLPVLVVTRRNPTGSDLAQALRSAGLDHRLALLERMPRAFGVGEGLYLAHAGASRAEAERLVLSCLAKSRLPEPLRVAHLIGQAIVLRESRGRV